MKQNYYRHDQCFYSNLVHFLFLLNYNQINGQIDVNGKYKYSSLDQFILTIDNLHSNYKLEVSIAISLEYKNRVDLF